MQQSTNYTTQQSTSQNNYSNDIIFRNFTNLNFQRQTNYQPSQNIFRKKTQKKQYLKVYSLLGNQKQWKLLSILKQKISQICSLSIQRKEEIFKQAKVIIKLNTILSKQNKTLNDLQTIRKYPQQYEQFLKRIDEFKKQKFRLLDQANQYVQTYSPKFGNCTDLSISLSSRIRLLKHYRNQAQTNNEQDQW